MEIHNEVYFLNIRIQYFINIPIKLPNGATKPPLDTTFVAHPPIGLNTWRPYKSFNLIDILYKLYATTLLKRT